MGAEVDFDVVDSGFRPRAVIPWSQYQKMHRLDNKDTSLNSGAFIQETPEKKRVGIPSRFISQVDLRNARPSTLKPLLPSDVSTNSNYSTSFRNARPASSLRNSAASASIIRPQSRQRKPSQPADFQVEGAEMYPAPRPPFVPLGAIPNGVQLRPMEGIQQRQFSSNTLTEAAIPQPGAFPSFPGSELPMVMPSGNSQSNIVNSIFAQSQAGRPPTFPMMQQGIPQLPGLPTGPNPIETLLANGAPLEQLGKIAKNFLSIPGAGKNDMLNLITTAFGGGSKAPLTSSAVQGSIDSDPLPALSAAREEPSLMERLFSTATNALQNSIREKQREDARLAEQKRRDDATSTTTMASLPDKDKESSLELIKGLPEDQRSLLEAAIRDGEVNAESLKPVLDNLVKEDRMPESKKEKEDRLIEWIKQNRPKIAKSSDSGSTVSADKLPYYGKYCGSFAEQAGISKQYHIEGAVWVVDNRRFIVSKFNFKPPSMLNENVTFWVGPREITGDNLQDMFPSADGFYVRPVKLDIASFQINDFKADKWRHLIRKNVQTIPANVRQSIVANVTSSASNSSTSIDPTKEKKLAQEIRRRRRRQVSLIVKGGMVPVPSASNESSLNNNDKLTSLDPSIPEHPTVLPPIPARYDIPEEEEEEESDPTAIVPLEWHAGFQPLLLTLPEGKWMKTIHWLALRDHKRQQTVASVLIPNGPGFQVPSVVQLRPLTPNGFYNISSGNIKVLNTKTIEISEFKLTTSGVPVWFMVGKDILPNANGHIVPLFDMTFDCDSLRDYNYETVTLRLPGPLDMKDVFWLSVFSVTNAVSFSHIYLPYNDMHLPPDLNGVTTPQCKWHGQ